MKNPMKTLRTIYTVAFALLISSTSFGQNMYDALRFSTMDYEGTARSMAMGNAFTALGGDLGGITINPAASGVYRYNEFTFTPSLTNTVEKSIYAGTLEKSTRTRFGLSNVGGVSTFDTGRKTGLVNFNLGVVANQTANFTSRSSVHGSQSATSKLASMAAAMTQYGVDSGTLTMTSEDPNAPFYYSKALWEEILAWNTSLVENIYDQYTYVGATENFIEDNIYAVGGPLDQTFYQETTGYKQDITLNLGANISHKFYFGANFTIQSLWYQKYQMLSEAAQNPDDFETDFEYFRHQFNQTISGVGFNIKAGMIYRPVAGLRLGATISTPTWSKYVDKNYEKMESEVYDERFQAESPVNSYQYRITSPLRWSLGAAYTFGSRALISVDYESTNYGGIRFKTDRSMYIDDIEYFNNENQAIKDYFRRVNNIRVGGEFKPIPQLSLRAGYNYLDTCEEGYDGSLHYVSAGVGFITKNNFFMDLAYRQQCRFTKEEYTLYDTGYFPSADEALVSTSYLNSRLLLTIGWRF